MSERMTPMPFGQLMDWLLAERENHGSVFGVSAAYVKKDGITLPLFREKLETPIGPAAGPNTQLAQNIIAAYYAGARFFELKTVQKMDGEELAACIARPCILAEDEGYNCEWSTELTVPQAFEEYVKAWFALKLISRKWELGDPMGFVFNMSVGYDLAGIQTPKLDDFIEGMKNAGVTPIFQQCKAWALERYPEDKEYIEGISPVICTGVTVSTLHGCPPEEIEAIASYLIREKGLNTFVKCNPTILGYDFARKRLDGMGYDYIAFDDHHFREDLQYKDAVPMFHRLKALAEEKGLEFGLKLSNTFPVDVKAGELPSEEMYLSGRALYLLTIEMAARMAKEFGGKLRLSYSGGADAFHIKGLFEAGVWPITVATTILKPGGYARLKQLAQLLETVPFVPFRGVNADQVAELSRLAEGDERIRKPVKPLPSRKMAEKVPLVDCFTAPCAAGCPIHQDIPQYLALVEKGLHEQALTLILEKNALPFITGTICAHRCMDKCTRNFYEESVQIRSAKLLAAEQGYDGVMAKLTPPEKKHGPKTAVIGGGPAGIAAAYFLAREGLPVTVFEKEDTLGGIVRHVIPGFRIGEDAVEKDAALAQKLGAEFVTGALAPSLYELKAQGYEYILLAFGAEKPGKLNIPGHVVNVIDFLRRAKKDAVDLRGQAVAVVGGGNTAMDAARAAKRMGAEKVSIVYRRTKKYMPADQEELELAVSDGVEFAELLAPVEQKGSVLICRKMALGEPDESGRRRPVETEELAEVPADVVIAAVGEKPDEAAFAAYGAKLDENGRAPFNCGAGVFAAGDALRGPATVVEAIADARRFADVVTGFARGYSIPSEARRDYREMLSRKRLLQQVDPQAKGCDGKRCLGCDTVCENCVSVCPNRANVAVKVKGHAMRQIVHIDRLCNECGNCATFCPYDSRPYREKLTLFATEGDFLDSENDGFLVLDREEKTIRLRLDGQVTEVELKKPNELEPSLENLILTVLRDYAYMI